MSNPFEAPSSQPPKPVDKEVPSVQTRRPDITMTPERTPVETLVQSPETLTDTEVLRNYTVPVPYTPEEMAAAKKRVDAEYTESETDNLSLEVIPESKEIENMRKVIELMDEFESKYPLQELHAIANIPLAELIKHPIRQPANVALVHIRKAMALAKVTPEIDDRYLRLSRAVGMYNSLSKTVDHDRG